MLKIIYGNCPEAIYNTSMYFNNTFQKAWLEDEFMRRMIKGVDRSEVIGDSLIKSRALGMIAPSQLSGGVKTLILTYLKPDMLFNASTCGDNCAGWFLKMCKREDRTINLRHIMDFGEGKTEILVVNNGELVQSMKELVMVAGDFL